jgi:hypothetical protein
LANATALTAHRQQAEGGADKRLVVHEQNDDRPAAA